MRQLRLQQVEKKLTSDIGYLDSSSVYLLLSNLVALEKYLNIHKAHLLQVLSELEIKWFVKITQQESSNASM